MRVVIDLGRVIRERKSISLKYPLKEIVVIHRDSQFLDDVKSLEEYILSELNVDGMVVSQDRQKYGVRLRAEPNFRLLGARLKDDQKKVTDYLKNKIAEDELEKFLDSGKLTVHGHELTSQEVGVVPAAVKQGAGEGMEMAVESACVVIIDTQEYPELIARGLAREVTNRVQKLRKTAKLVKTDSAVVYCTVSPPESELGAALGEHHVLVHQLTGTPILVESVPAGVEVSAESDETDEIRGARLKLRLVVGVTKEE